MKHLFRSLACMALMASFLLTAQEHTTENTRFYARPYNLVYTNNASRIASEVFSFAFKNPGILKLLGNKEFVDSIWHLLSNGKPLPEYFKTFETYDSSGRIKELARTLTTEGKDGISEGTELIEAIIKQGFEVVFVTSQDEQQVKELAKKFSVLQLAKKIMSRKTDEDEGSFLARANDDNPKEHGIYIAYTDSNTIELAQKAGLQVALFKTKEQAAQELKTKFGIPI